MTLYNSDDTQQFDSSNDHANCSDDHRQTDSGEDTSGENASTGVSQPTPNASAADTPETESTRSSSSPISPSSSSEAQQEETPNSLNIVDDAVDHSLEFDNAHFANSNPIDPTALNDLKQQLEAAHTAQEEAKNRELLIMADMENLRRRTEKEKQSARVYSITKFAQDIVNIADNLDRALSSCKTDDSVQSEPSPPQVDPSESGNGDSARFKSLMEGVEITAKMLASALEKHGIVRLEPLGERFDPNFHEAMFEAPDISVPKGFVASVVQVGYQIGDRVLRPAMVGVSSGSAVDSPDSVNQTQS